MKSYFKIFKTYFYNRKVECKIFMEFSKTVATLPDKECPGVKPPETEICVDTPSCSGSGSMQIMSDHQVNIVKETLPIVNEPELLALLAGDEARSDPETADEPTYSWKIAGFTTCTASCLGGRYFLFKYLNILTCLLCYCELVMVPH